MATHKIKVPHIATINSIFNRAKGRKATELIPAFDSAERDSYKTNYPVIAEYYANRDTLTADTTVEIYADKDLTKLVARVLPSERANILKYETARPVFVPATETGAVANAQIIAGGGAPEAVASAVVVAVESESGAVQADDDAPAIKLPENTYSVRPVILDSKAYWVDTYGNGMWDFYSLDWVGYLVKGAKSTIDTTRSPPKVSTLDIRTEMGTNKYIKEQQDKKRAEAKAKAEFKDWEKSPFFTTKITVGTLPEMRKQGFRKLERQYSSTQYWWHEETNDVFLITGEYVGNISASDVLDQKTPPSVE